MAVAVRCLCGQSSCNCKSQIPARLLAKDRYPRGLLLILEDHASVGTCRTCAGQYHVSIRPHRREDTNPSLHRRVGYTAATVVSMSFTKICSVAAPLQNF